MQTALVKTRAFSLIELLLVVGIVLILAALVVPVLGKARQTAVSMACANNVRNLAAAGMMAAYDNEGVLPGDYRDGRCIGFHYQLRPYLTRNDDPSLTSELYGCPAVRDSGTAPEWHLGMRYNYAVNVFLPGKRFTRIDRPSQRVFFLDAPPTVDCRAADRYWESRVPYRHRNGLTVAYADGHVDRISRADRTGSRRRRDPAFGDGAPSPVLVLAGRSRPDRPSSRPDDDLGGGSGGTVGVAGIRRPSDSSGGDSGGR